MGNTTRLIIKSVNSSLTGLDILNSKNEKMLRCIDLAHIACKSSAPVMLIGENGVGKKIMARAIHHASPKHSRPCLTFDCSSLGDSEIKKTLFGDKWSGKPDAGGDDGLLAQAKGGTLIIDSVDLLPGFIQRELLAILMNRAKISPAGGEPAVLRMGTRIIATSGSELTQKVANGLFVEELMYCLGELTIRVPPLRERVEDLEDLTDISIKAANAETGKSVLGLSRTAMAFIRHYDFPGNIRELFTIIHRAVRKTSRDIVYAEELGFAIDAVAEHPHLTANMTILPLAEMEKRHISKVLLKTAWKVKAAARLLRISETMLRRKMKLYSLEHDARIGK